MTPRLNLGLAALLALLALATAFAISHRAAVPDPASCVGRMVEGIRKDGLGYRAPPRFCRRARSTGY